MCFSSCLGGSQKPVKVIVSLEFSSQVIGHQVFEVKVCASPGRDRNTEEAKRIENKQSKKTLVNTDANKPPCHLMNTRSLSNLKSISALSDTENSEVFTLQIKGRKNYDLLRHIRDAFDALAAIQKLRKFVSENSSTVSETLKKKSSCNVDIEHRTNDSSITLEE